MPSEPNLGPVPPASGGILIVDDEALIAAYLEDTLDALGYRTTGIAGSADEAIALANAERPAVAIVDIGLRGSTDGISVARELIDRLGVAVVFLTGSADAATRRAAEAVRPRGFLTKPCTDAEIEAVLRSVMDALDAAPGADPRP